MREKKALSQRTFEHSLVILVPSLNNMYKETATHTLSLLVYVGLGGLNHNLLDEKINTSIYPLTLLVPK